MNKQNLNEIQDMWADPVNGPEPCYYYIVQIRLKNIHKLYVLWWSRTGPDRTGTTTHLSQFGRKLHAVVNNEAWSRLDPARPGSLCSVSFSQSSHLLTSSTESVHRRGNESAGMFGMWKQVMETREQLQTSRLNNQPRSDRAGNQNIWCFLLPTAVINN